MDNLSKFSERLKELMIERNIKSNELGVAIGVDGSNIRRWLRGVNSVALNQLVKLAIYFNCPVDFLVGRIEYYERFKPKTCPVFIENLYKILEEKGVSTYKLNNDTSIKYGLLTRWRKGTVPHLTSLLELANYLDCSIDYLIGLES